MRESERHVLVSKCKLVGEHIRHYSACCILLVANIQAYLTTSNISCDSLAGCLLIHSADQPVEGEDHRGHLLSFGWCPFEYLV